MKKKIIIGLVTAALVGVALFQVVPALADTPNPVDHVVISPAATTLLVGGQQLFTAQAQDSSNATVAGVTYFWLVTAGGTIVPNGATATFTAGGVPGTYANAVEVVAVQNSITKVATATVTVTGTPGALNHVTLTPANVTMAPGGTQQFTAQGFDAANIPISGLNYSWSAQNAAGSITASSNNVITFKAGANTGTFANAITASTTSGTLSGSASASIVVAIPPASIPTPSPTPGFDSAKLIKMFGGLLNKVGFENFLGGQFQVKNGASTDTIKVIPGVVQGVPSSTSLTVLPNGQSANATFTLTGVTVIVPKGTTLAANQKVVVITVNDVVRVVAVVNPVTTGTTPPGINKKGDDKREGKQNPPGWSHGKKIGWGSGNGNQGRGQNDQGENEDD